MGTRIIVLNEGIVQQYGTPKEIYDRPASTFVAKFIGSPPMNLLPVEKTDFGVLIEGAKLPNSENIAQVFETTGQDTSLLGIRAEKIAISANGSSEGLPGVVAMVEHLGAETVVGFKLGEDADTTSVGASTYRDLHYARIAGDADLTHGQPCRIKFDLAGVSWFDPATGLRVEAA